MLWDMDIKGTAALLEEFCCPKLVLTPLKQKIKKSCNREGIVRHNNKTKQIK